MHVNSCCCWALPTACLWVPRRALQIAFPYKEENWPTESTFHRRPASTERFQFWNANHLIADRPNRFSPYLCISHVWTLPLIVFQRILAGLFTSNSLYIILHSLAIITPRNQRSTLANFISSGSPSNWIANKAAQVSIYGGIFALA